MTISTSRWQRIGKYFSLIKFSHTVFALPFALIGFALGLQDKLLAEPTWIWQTAFWPLFAKVLLCMIFARSTAMGFNRYLDRKYDALNPRTAKREIPAGLITPQNALAFTISCAIGFIITTWFINPLCFYLSFVALFVILFYSYTKRFTALCHLVLGAGLALAPIGAYIAVTNVFTLIPILFSLAVFCWVGGFDIIYALQDEDFDKSNNLKSIPAALGPKGALAASSLLHFGTAILIFTAGYLGEFHWLYWMAEFVFIALLAYQHWLVKPNDLSKVNMAFANTNGIASMIFACLTITSIVIKIYAS